MDGWTDGWTDGQIDGWGGVAISPSRAGPSARREITTSYHTYASCVINTCIHTYYMANNILLKKVCVINLFSK